MILGQDQAEVAGANDEPWSVLVTGASGFVGSHLVQVLADSGHRVIAVDAVAGSGTVDDAGSTGVETVTMDLRDRAALEELVSRSTHVVHLAAIRPKVAAAEPRMAFEVNVCVSNDLIEFASRHQIRRFIFGSSHSIYGGLSEPREYRFRETDAFGPGLNLYGATKLAVEALLSAQGNMGGPGHLSLRLGTIYGPRANRDNSLGGIMMDVVDAVRQGGRTTVPWAPDALHDLVYVEDAANAIVMALRSPLTGLAINVTGEPVSSLRIFERLVELAGGSPDLIDWESHLRRYQMTSNERLCQTLGPVCRTSLDAGLAAFIEWHEASV